MKLVGLINLRYRLFKSGQWCPIVGVISWKKGQFEFKYEDKTGLLQVVEDVLVGCGVRKDIKYFFGKLESAW